jgi:hypothetical protein
MLLGNFAYLLIASFSRFSRRESRKEIRNGSCAMASKINSVKDKSGFLCARRIEVLSVRVTCTCYVIII